MNAEIDILVKYFTMSECVSKADYTKNLKFPFYADNKSRLIQLQSALTQTFSF